MSKKTKFSPKVKHKAFASFSVKLQDNDWMIGIFNPNDKTASYFLAEPTLPNKNSGPQIRTTEFKHQGYLVSALSRQGLSESSFTGLPRKFKAVEDAMEWLEGQVEQYDGDKALPLLQVDEEGVPNDGLYERTIADFKSNDETLLTDLELLKQEGSTQNFVNQVEYFAKESVKSPGKAGAVTGRTSSKTDKAEKKLSKTGKEIKPQGPNGAKSTKTVHSDQPYIKPVSKFKTSKDELKSLGLDGLFDD